jgi:hypothetical protein
LNNKTTINASLKMIFLKHINAIALQKKHAGIKFLKGKYQPDAVFNKFKDLRSLLIKLKN